MIDKNDELDEFIEAVGEEYEEPPLPTGSLFLTLFQRAVGAALANEIIGVPPVSGTKNDD